MTVTLGSETLRADLYSTLGPNGEYDSANGSFIDGINYYNQVLAMPFTPDENSPAYDAVLALGNYAGNNNPVSLYVYDDNGGFPGSTQLDTLVQHGTIPSFYSGGGLVWFFCRTCPTLSAGTQYWLVALETDPGTEQAWLYAYHDQVGPFAWNQKGSITGPWNQQTDVLGGFRIDGWIPEPGTLVMMGTGMLVGAGGLRRKLGKKSV